MRHFSFIPELYRNFTPVGLKRFGTDKVSLKIQYLPILKKLMNIQASSIINQMSLQSVFK